MSVTTRPPLSVLFLESSKNFGGQERRLLHEALLLEGKGHRALIASPGDGILYRRAAEAGLATFPIKMRNSIAPSSIALLCKVIMTNSVDIIYSHSGKDSWLGGISGLLTKVLLVRSRELLNPIKHAFS